MPSPEVSAVCSGQWPSRELEVLGPRIVCWLTKTVGFPLARCMAARAGAQPLEFGIPSSAAPAETRPCGWQRLGLGV